ncbi:HesB/YadR/YfhF family protein [uncultured Metabacillus sp.]|uniref:HesB/YadR/YfhF family protein n=1 Tax=uncultured Metabacillus sp. TaxID=2860135 RepID=UPI002603293C|nr:HesB/YadR/YfhF family protein [uncultured Metabacillus sp.]
MEMIIDDKAANWYIEELQLQKGDMVQFFVRYGGCSNVQKGFSLGVAKQQPEEIGASVELNGITFFVENRDLWYFDNHNLRVELDEEVNEPFFTYIEQ